MSNLLLDSAMQCLPSSVTMPAVLMVKQASGRYARATDRDVLLRSAEIMGARLPKSVDAENPEAMKKYFMGRLRPYEHEIFCVLFLDQKHHTIKCVDMFRGTIDGASVHLREVVKAALLCNAAAVVFAHNHPSGNSEPSTADIRITERLNQALKLVDIRVLDHIIVGASDCVALSDRNLL